MTHTVMYPDIGAAVPEVTPWTKAIAKAALANEPPTVLVIFVRPVAMAVSPIGAADAAAAGSAATSAPEPSPAITMQAVTSTRLPCSRTSPK